MAILPQPYNTRLEAISRTTQDGFLTLVGGVLTLAASSGVGNVSGPASSTANAIPVYADETGKVLKNSLAGINDNGTLHTTNFRVGGASGNIIRLASDGSTSFRGSNINVPNSITMGGGSKVQSRSTGSYAEPGITRLTFCRNSTIPANEDLNDATSYLLGSIDFLSYQANSVAADLSLWVNPSSYLLKDFSNRTHDLVIRGATGNVEIQRGRLILTNDLQLGGPSGPRIKNVGSVVTFRNNNDTVGAGIDVGSLSTIGIVKAGYFEFGPSESPNWRLYGLGTKIGYLRDMENSRSHVTFTPGATDADAITGFASRVVVNTDIQLGGTTGPRIKNESGWVSFRNSADSVYVDLKANNYRVNTFQIHSHSVDQGTHGRYLLAFEEISGEFLPARFQIGSGSIVRGNRTGSAADPGRTELVFSNANGNTSHPDSQRIAGSIEGRTYTATWVYADLVFWANPDVNIRDKSNHTQDFILRGQTGNVEIKRGNLITDNHLFIGGSSGVRLKNSGSTVLLRNSADTANVGIEASTGTFSGPITSGFQTITDDSQVTTAILLPGQSRLFYNSTSDTLSTWTNVGGKLYKSQPHVEV